MNDTLMTARGLEQLEKELEDLRLERTDAVGWLCATLANRGNPANDPEYLLARNELAQLEQKLATLEARLRDAELVDADPTDGKVGIGEEVRVRDLASGETLDFQIVGRGEADPEIGRISYRSPVGSALLGRQTGDLVEFDAPHGRVRLEVLAAT